MASLSLDLFRAPMYSIVAGALVLIIFCILKIVRGSQELSFARQHGCQPPVHSVSHGLFGIGMIMEMVRAGEEHNFVETVHSWHQKYGGTFKAKMATRTAIFTVEPQNIQTVLALKFKDFSIGETRQKAFRPVFGDGIFTIDGHRWENTRALLRPNFSRSQITNTQLYEAHVADLLEKIPQDGSTVDLQDLFLSQTLDTSTEFLFGESVHSLRDDPSDTLSFANTFNAAQDGSAIRAKLGPFMGFYRNKVYWKARTNLRNYVGRFAQRAIDYRIAINSGKNIPEEIKQLPDNQYVFAYGLTKQTLDKKEITDQMLSILIAGRDTTANLLSISFFILAKRPDIWKKLRSEVLALGGRKPSFEDIKSMTYMTWIFNESLRLYPIVPFNIRSATKDTYLPVGGGPDGKSPIFVPKGAEIMYNAHTMHRNLEVYGPDADEYRPERWEKLNPGWAYIPFSGGPRICLGQQFALTEAGYTTVRILQEFRDIESRDPSPFVEALNLTLSSANGTKVSLTPVHDS